MSDEMGDNVEIHRVLREDRKLDDDYTTAAGTRDDAWLGTELTVEFAGEGTHVAAIDIAGRRLERTLQIPDDLPPGPVRIIARLSDTPPAGPQLIYSTMRLLGAEEDAAAAIYTFEAIGKNVAAFTAPREDIELTAPDGAAIEPETAECFSWHVIEFPGRGRFVLRVR